MPVGTYTLTTKYFSFARAGRDSRSVARSFDVEAGDVLTAPAAVPHKFHNLGPGRFETVDLHLSPRWIQTDLDDPEGSDV